MNDRREIELLIEITKLLKKYGTETFSRLADMLSTPQLNDQIIVTLTKTIDISRTLKAEKVETKRTPRDFRSHLVELGSSEPEKFDLLLQFYDNLIGKSILPSLREIKSFVFDTGLPPIKATTRNKAIVPLLKSLSGLSLDELKAKISMVRTVSPQNDRSLEGWSNIILDKGRRNNQ